MAGSHNLSFGPYRLDIQKEQFWHEHQPVRLTPKAFQVLCYLVERPGQLVTKEELFQVLWADTVVSDAALTTCIQEIRKALQDNARSPQYVETVPRRGFRFIAPVTAPAAPVSSFEFQVPSQEEESQTAKSENGLTSNVQSLESENQDISLSSVQTLDARPQTLDAVVPAQRSWSVRSLVFTGFVLLAAVILIVQYLSRPILSTQTSVLVTEEAKPPSLLLPDKPSIIVLPFVNLSEDPKQEYFSDGFTEVLTGDLSKISSLFVIARNSAFTYKGKAAKVQDVSKEMGVRYVLEGSVQKADQRVRITTQLIDATTGFHLWSEQYDRPLQDLFALQDEVVQKIVTTLKLQLTLEEQGILVRKHTDNLEAYDAFLRGVEYYWRYTKEANRQTRQMFEKAVALDSQYAEAYACLSWTYYQEWVLGLSTDPQTLERALALAQQAVTLDDSLPGAHTALNLVYGLKQQYDQAIAEGERAIALDPNNADSYANQASVLNGAGRPEDALRAMEQAMRLNPRYPYWYLLQSDVAYLSTGRYAEAITTLQEVIRRNPNYIFAHFLLARSYLAEWASQLNQDPRTLEQALAAAQRAIALNDASPWGHGTLGFVYLWQKQYDQAVAEIKRVIALAPNAAGGYAGLAEMLSRMGRSEEALQMVEQALRRNPSVDAYPSIGGAYYLTGRPEEAVVPFKQYLSRYPNILPAHLTLAAIYSDLGRDAEARTEAAEVLRLNPHFTLEVARQRSPIKDPVVLERIIAALRKAGLK